MTNLREAVIKLANEKPELRKHLVPLLRKTAVIIYEPFPPDEPENDAYHKNLATKTMWGKIKRFDPDAQFLKNTDLNLKGGEASLAFFSNRVPTREGRRFQSVVPLLYTEAGGDFLGGWIYYTPW